jgi:hypothetical protein
VLRAFETARNSAGVDAVTEFYAQDAVVKEGPLDEDGIANGKDEIRSMEAQFPGIEDRLVG